MDDAKNRSMEEYILGERYLVEKPLKLAGFKDSYHCADQHENQRPSVIKILQVSGKLHGDMWDLSRDWSLHRRLHHPNLVPVVDFGIMEDAHKFYFVEEWISGTDLFSGTDGMSVVEVLSILAEIFKALRFLHRRGIVHGSIKPSNIIVISDGNIGRRFKITDPGLHRFRPVSDLKAVETCGMLPYAAPEVLLGGRADLASDIYSLGIIAYLLLMRRLPFEGSDPGFLVQKHMQGFPDFKPLRNMKWAKHFVPLMQSMLGKDPGKRTDLLDESIDVIQAGLRTGSVFVNTGDDPESRLSATRFVGRESEMRCLRERAERAHETGRGWTVFLSGEAGSGKTRCMEELKEWGRLQGWRVIEGICNVREEGSYSPFRTILSAIGPEGQEGIFLSGQSLLGEDSGIFNASTEYAAGQFRDLLTRKLVRHLAGNPTLLLLDDFQETDEATAQILDYLSSDICAHPILMCIGFRPSENPAGALYRIVQLAERQGRGELLTLEALSEESVGRIIELVTGTSDLMGSLGAWIYRHVGGNPFFLEEMLKYLIEQGILKYSRGEWQFQLKVPEKLEVPDSVRIVIKRRLDSLNRLSRKMAGWLSLIHRPVPIRFLQNVMTLDSAQIKAALGELADRQMVRLSTKEKEGTVEFQHSLIGEVLRSRISRKKRVEMHARIALELEREARSSAHLQELAWHSMEGKLGAKAVRYALSLAARCRMEFSHEVAARCFEYVLDDRSGLEWEALCRVSIDAADTMIAMGLPARAIRRLKDEISRNRRIPRDLKGMMFMKLALSCQYLGDFAGQRDYCMRGLRLFRGIPLSEKNLTRSMLYAELAFGAAVQSHPRQGLIFLRKAIQTCPDIGAEALSGRIQSIAAFLHRVGCNLEQALESSQMATKILSRTDECYLTCSAFSTLGFIHMNLGRLGPSLETHRRAVRLSERSRAVIPRAQALGNLAECLCRIGRIREARKEMEKAIQAAEESGNPTIGHALQTSMAEILLAGNDYSAAYQLIKRIIPGSATERARYAVGHAHYIAAHLYFALGDFESAKKFVRKLQRIESPEAPCYEREMAEALNARILFEQKRPGEAVKRLVALDKAVTRKKWPYQQTLIKLHLAEILIEKKDFARVSKYVRDAYRLARAMQSEYLISYSRLLSGVLYARIHLKDCGMERSHFSSEDKLDGRRVFQSSLMELRESVQAAELGGYKEISWRGHAELSILYDTLQDGDECLRHARVAYECMCNLESRVPGEMLASYKNAFRRSRKKAELVRMIESTPYDLPLKSALHSTRDLSDNSRFFSRMSETFSTIGDLDPLLEAILSQLIQALDMERALVCLSDEDKDVWRQAKSICKSGGTVETAILPYILDEVGQKGNPVISANIGRDARFEGKNRSASYKPGRLLAAPLKVAGKTIGLLYTDHSLPSESFNESVISLFSAFCNLSAIAIHNAVAQEKLVQENAALGRYLQQNREPYAEIVGSSRAAETLRDRIAIVAASPLDVLITGESGTGKELVAKAIHRTSRRHSGKFIPIDCGALSDSLAEAELFGYRRGAFTGASENRPGLLEAANGGILFLDEISNTPIRMQAKFLRVLEEREVRRIGETAARGIDIQIIAATNRDLAAEIEAGRFREDLYFRLQKMDIRVPPLRERPEDIPELVDYFLEKLSKEDGGRSKRFSRRAMEVLKGHSYPGNIRELYNTVSRAFYSAADNIIEPESLSPELFAEKAGCKEAGPGLAAQTYRKIREGKGRFEDLVKVPFLERKIDVAVVRSVMREALSDSRGRYREAFAVLGIPEESYAATLQFLKRHDCYLDFRPFRKKNK